MTLTLTLDQVVLHTIMHHSSTSTYMPNFIEIKETFRGQMDVCAYVRTHIRTHVRTYARTDGHSRPALLGRLWEESS